MLLANFAYELGMANQGDINNLQHAELAMQEKIALIDQQWALHLK